MNKYIWAFVALYTGFTAGLLLWPDTYYYQSTFYKPEKPTATSTDTQVKSYVSYRLKRLGLNEEEQKMFIRIATCESSMRHYTKEGVLDNKGLNKNGTTDVGLLQINQETWGPVAKKLGYDIKTLDGNLAMGAYILKDGQGVSAWNASSHCHGYR